MMIRTVRRVTATTVATMAAFVSPFRICDTGVDWTAAKNPMNVVTSSCHLAELGLIFVHPILYNVIKGLVGWLCQIWLFLLYLLSRILTGYDAALVRPHSFLCTYGHQARSVGRISAGVDDYRLVRGV